MTDDAGSHEKTQSGRQVALAVLGFILGTVAIALIIKAIFF
jgi:hypothetical protein